MVHRDISIVARGGIILLSRSLAHLEITAPEFFLLLYLYENEQSRQEDLVDFFMLDKGSIARTLQKLESKGLVIRTVDEKDQRKKFIQLSEKGYSLKGDCLDLVHDWHQMILKDIPEEDYQVFMRVLNLMALNIVRNLANQEAQNEK